MPLSKKDRVNRYLDAQDDLLRGDIEKARQILHELTLSALSERERQAFDAIGKATIATGTDLALIVQGISPGYGANLLHTLHDMRLIERRAGRWFVRGGWDER